MTVSLVGFGAVAGFGSGEALDDDFDLDEPVFATFRGSGGISLVIVWLVLARAARSVIRASSLRSRSSRAAPMRLPISPPTAPPMSAPIHVSLPVLFAMMPPSIAPPAVPIAVPVCSFDPPVVARHPDKLIVINNVIVKVKSLCIGIFHAVVGCDGRGIGKTNPMTKSIGASLKMLGWI